MAVDFLSINALESAKSKIKVNHEYNVLGTNE